MQKPRPVVAPGIADERDTFVVVVVAAVRFGDIVRFSSPQPKTYIPKAR